MRKSPRMGFSLIELSIVILIIGILVVGITRGSRIIYEARLRSARALTASSPVTSINDVVMWLESTSEKSFTASQAVDTALSSDGTITNWFDINPQTTSGSNAIQYGDSTLRPRYVAGGINGLPVVNFDGTSDYFDFNGTALVNNNLTVFAVSQIHNDSSIGNEFFISGPNLDVLVMGYSNNNYYVELYLSSGPQATFSTLTDRKPVVMSMAHSSTRGIELYVNGQLTASSPSHTNHLTNYSGATIGKSGWSGGYFKGNIGEIIMFNRLLSNLERAGIEDYLKTKWGIK